MPLLSNVIISTGRSSYNSGTGQTGAETANLTGVRAHAQPSKEHSLNIRSEHLLESVYEINVDSGTDIAIEDTITSCTLLDGVTNWPSDSAWGSNQWWRVVYVVELAAALLPSRMVYVARIRKAGPSH